MTETTVIRETTVKVDLVPWWLVLLEGLAALIIGIYLIISPVSTTIFLVQVLGWYWLISGILTIVTIFMDRTNWIWRGLGGLLGILLGILVIGNPLWSAVLVPGTLILVAGFLALCFGFVSLFWALKEGWGAAIMGVLSILFGVLLLASPMVGITVLVYLLGALGIVGGIVAIYMALKLRSA
jgi:uncharacterized membrane protein HdeD (DUF308 family)